MNMFKTLAMAGMAAISLNARPADEIVPIANSAFDEHDGDRAVGWYRNKPNGFRWQAGSGVNGAGGLVWEGVATNAANVTQDLKAGWEHGEAYHYSAYIKTDGWQPVGRGAQIYVEYYNAQKRWIGCDAIDAPKERDSGWVYVEGVTKAIPTNAVRVRIMPYVVKGTKGKVTFDNLVMRRYRRAPVAFVTSDAYRDTASAGTVRFCAAVNAVQGEENGLSTTFTWTDANGRRQTRDVPVTDARDAVLTLDVASLALGPSDVICRLSRRGQALGAATNRFVRTANDVPRKVRIDRFGRCLVDGKPFFPLGMYWTHHSKQRWIDEFARSPFNSLMPYTWVKPEDLDRFDKAGLKVIVSAQGLFLGSSRMRQRKITEQAQVDELMAKKIAEYGQKPALLGWYALDEAPTTQARELGVMYRYFREHDPEHPVWAVLDRLHDLRDFMQVYDVLGMDPYPVGRYPMEHVTKFMRGTKREIFDARPRWDVPQAFSWGKRPPNHFPTESEYRNICWQHLANGSKGLIAFEYGKQFVDNGEAGSNNWVTVCKVADEIRESIPMLLSVEPAPTVVAAEPEILAARAWTLDGTTRVLAVNPTQQPMHATLKLSDGRTLVYDLPPLGVSLKPLH